MKKIVSLILVLTICLVGCGSSSSIDAKDLGKYLNENGDFEYKLSKVDSKRITIQLGLEKDDYDAVYYYAAGGAIAEEIIVITGDDTDKIKEKLDSYKDYRYNQFSTYAPDEASKIKKSDVEIKDNAVILVISKDGSKVNSILDKYSN